MCTFQETSLQAFSYNDSSWALRRDIAEFLDIIWPNTSTPNAQSLRIQGLATTHRAELLARSFCWYADNKLMGYAAVVHKEIFHGGHSFRSAGLSCVATHPNIQGQGVGSALVSAATQYIVSQQDMDFGIFTCQPELADFYKKAGGWIVWPDITLLGSHDPKALSNTSLNVVVLMRLISAKAKAHKHALCREPVSLEFPLGEFL